MLEIDKLTQFTVLARLGSYTAAAAALHVSQPTLTRSVQSLEKTLNAKLLDRGRNGVALTAIGAQFLEQAEDLLRRADNIEENIAEHARGARGHVRFGYGPMIGSVILPAVATKVVQSHLDITIATISTHAQTMHDMLLAGEVDFFVSREPMQGWSERILPVRLGRMRPDFFVRTGHPLASREVVTFEDLGDYPRVCGTAWNELLPLSAPPEVHRFARATIETDDASTPRLLATQIDAVITSHAGLNHEGLVRLDIADRGSSFPDRDIVLNRYAQRTLSPAAQHVMGLVIDVARNIYGEIALPDVGDGRPGGSSRADFRPALRTD